MSHYSGIITNMSRERAHSGITELGFGDLANGSVAGSLVGSIAMMFINKVYYDKRAELFVN